MIRNAILKARQQIIVLLVACIGASTTAIYLSGDRTIAQTISQTDNPSVTPVANVNEVKTFVYSWFALLDRQVAEISLVKFLDEDNLTMEFPEMTVNNPNDFSEWYLGVQEAIKSNVHDVRQVDVTPQGNGQFDVTVEVKWQAQTREDEAIEQAYQQQWKIITDRNRRLLIQEYLVEEVE